MVIDESGRPPLPWLQAPLADTLARQRGHALLLHGAAGVGTLEFAIALAQSWLCEAHPSASPAPACGRCPSCHGVQQRVHPDLFVLLPEAARVATNWLLPGDRSDADEGKKKPSRQIRIDEVRQVIDWVVKTSGRGRGKVVVVHPGEALNLQAANALLKTIEEPPPGTRVVIGVGEPAQLLPTVRSRCQHVALAAPALDEATRWLEAQGVADAPVLLAAASGRPLEALAMASGGVTAAHWLALPRALGRGDVAAVQGWAVPRVVDAMQKLCHDAMAVAVGAPPRFFVGAALPRVGIAQASEWSRALARVARHDEHPWNEALLLESLVGQARRALTLEA